MDRMRSLDGVKIGCFFPWQTFAASGARTRFTTLWRYFLSQGAHVTLGLLQPCKFKHYENLSIREYSGLRRYQLPEVIANHHSQLLLRPEFAKTSRDAALFLHLFSKENYTQTPGFEEWALSIIRDVDVVSVDYPMMVPFLAPLCRAHGKPILLTALDALHKLHGGDSEAGRLLKELEEDAFSMVDSLFFVAEEDRRAFSSSHPHTHVVVNTGDAFSVRQAVTPEAVQRVEALYGVGQRPFVLFVGSRHAPNVDAADRLREMSRTVSEIDVVIAGTCCENTTEGNFKSLGTVSDSTLELLYHSADIVVIPLTSGSGSSLKFYEAMAYGKPVISTAVGARGHSVVAGRDLVVEDCVEKFADRIRELRRDTARMQALSKAARAYAELHDFRTTFAPYTPEIIRLLSDKTPTRNAHARASKKPKLIMVDPGLKDDVGHYLPYATSIKEAAEEFGFEFRTLVHRDATKEVCEAVHGVPCFRFGIHDIAYDTGLLDVGSPSENYRYGVLKTNEVFATDLWKGLKGIIGFEDQLFFPNVTERQFLGLASAISFTPIGHYPRSHAMLRYPLCLPTSQVDEQGDRFVVKPNEDLVALYQIGFEALRDGGRNVSLHLVTDSAALAREYRGFTDIPIDVVPIPHTHPEGLKDEVFLKTLPKKEPGQIRVVYLGDARGEKGFGMLPFSVMALTDRFGVDRVQFVFQAFVSSSHHSSMDDAIQELQGLALPNVHLIKRPLSEAEYHTLLDSADLVLLPYNGLVYRSRTSGPFVEALCAGKPIVAPAHTWMAEELGDSRAGTFFQEGTDAEFYAACVSAIEDLQHNSRAAREFGESYQRYHNPRSFVERMFAHYMPHIDSRAATPVTQERSRLHPAIELIGESLASSRANELPVPSEVSSSLVRAHNSLSS